MSNGSEGTPDEVASEFATVSDRLYQIADDVHQPEEVRDTCALAAARIITSRAQRELQIDEIKQLERAIAAVQAERDRLSDQWHEARAERGDTEVRADQMRRDAELIDDTALEWAGTPLGGPAEQLVPASLARESALAGMARAAERLRALASGCAG